MSLLKALRLPQDPRSPAAMWISYGLRILVLATALFLLVRGEWSTALSTLLIAVLMTVPSVLSQRYRVYIPVSLDLGTVIFLFLTLFLGSVAQLYDTIPFWDKFLHFQSGLLLGATGFRLVYSLQAGDKRSVRLTPLFIAVFAVAFSLAIGAFWEIGEFFWDIAFDRQSQASLADTMWDLIADFSGALILSVSGYIWMRRNKGVPFTPE